MSATAYDMVADGSPVIALLTTTLDWGGSEGNAVELARGYARRGLRTAVIVDQPPLHRRSALEDANIPLRVLGVEKGWSAGRYRSELGMALRHWGAALVHGHIWERMPEMLQVADTLQIPAVITQHTTISCAWRFRVGLVGRPFRYWRNRRAMRRSNPIVINISEVSDANFRELYPQVTRTRRIYCGAFLPPVPNDAAWEGDAPHVLWVGSMTERKRPLLALEIWRSILKEYPKCQLTLVGDGPLLSCVRAAAKTFPTGTVHVPGSVSDMAALLRDTQIMFHTATQEGIPKNIIYANTFGFPTVSTDVGAISESVINGRTGYLCADAADLELALRTLVAEPRRRADMGRAARERAEGLFDLERHIEENLRVYSELGGLTVAHVGACDDKPATLT